MIKPLICCFYNPDCCENVLSAPDAAFCLLVGLLLFLFIGFAVASGGFATIPILGAIAASMGGLGFTLGFTTAITIGLLILKKIGEAIYKCCTSAAEENSAPSQTSSTQTMQEAMPQIKRKQSSEIQTMSAKDKARLEEILQAGLPEPRTFNNNEQSREREQAVMAATFS